jgi:hypothetical protein
MATYDELLTIATSPSGDNLRKKLRVAVVVAADVVRVENISTPNHTNRLAWARQVMTNPDAEAARMQWAVLGQNRAFTAAQITGADDTTVQTAVNGAIDLLAGTEA